MMKVKVGKAIKPSHIPLLSPFSVEIDLSLKCSYGNHMPCLFYIHLIIFLYNNLASRGLPMIVSRQLAKRTVN